jgi:hypothetical protein
MKNLLFPFFAVTLFLTACNTSADPFLITKHSVGKLNDSTKVKDLRRVFEADSLSQPIGGDEFTGNINIIKVYEKETRKLLLELTPKEALDSLSTIQTVRIIDNRYKTKKSLDKLCDFSCLSANYNVSGVQNTLRNLIISVDEINAFFTIDKIELPENLRYDISKKIEVISIPPTAKIKDFFIQWY